jgi:hypothetical protein
MYEKKALYTKSDEEILIRKVVWSILESLY